MQHEIKNQNNETIVELKKKNMNETTQNKTKAKSIQANMAVSGFCLC